MDTNKENKKYFAISGTRSCVVKSSLNESFKLVKVETVECKSLDESNSCMHMNIHKELNGKKNILFCEADRHKYAG